MTFKRIFRQVLLIAVAVLPLKAVAECSPFAGLASINEIAEKNNFKWIEIKRLSSVLTWEASDPWSIIWCVDDASPACSTPLDLPAATSGSSLWIESDVGGTAPDIDLRAMDVRLLDSNGRTVDYVSVNGFQDGEDSECPAGSEELPFSNELTHTEGNSGQFAKRVPDGTGDWALGTGGSDGGDSLGETNDSGSIPGPSISIDNVSVDQGSDAVFTLTLSAAAGVEFRLDYQTQDLTAVASEDYTATQGTLIIPQDATEVTLSVPTLVNGASAESQFFIVIGNSRNGADERYGTFSSQAGVGTILPVASLERFQVSASATASVCEPLEVSLEALDSDGNLLTSYKGTVNLLSSSGSGTWAKGAATGALSPDPDTSNDGAAQYSFASTDGGSVSLLFSNRSADEITVSATDDDTGETGASGAIQFAKNAFLIRSVDANGLDIIAERNHAFRVEAVARDEVTEKCALISEYDGSVGVKTWLNRTINDAGGDPPILTAGATGASPPDSQPAVNNLTIEFSEGVAPLVLSPTDVGQYYLNLRDDASNIVTDTQGNSLVVAGSSELWTVRPDRFELTVAGNPEANDAAGPKFIAAGESFELTLTALGANGTPTESYGKEGAAQGAELSSALVAPSGGETGTLSGTVSVPGAKFSSGAATIDDLSWNEVGILQIDALNSSYLGVALPVIGQSAPVGRFFPAKFGISVPDPGQFAPFCSVTTEFVYSGQAMEWAISPELVITAYGPGVYITRNYTGGYRKLVGSDVSRIEPVSDENAVTSESVKYPVSTTMGAGALTEMAPGVMSFVFSNADSVVYEKSPDSVVAPFSPELIYTIDTVIDSDEVEAADTPLSLTPSAPLEIRYGRWAMENVYGPETAAELQMPFGVEYWDGSGFTVNAADSCSTWSTSLISNPEEHHTLSADSGTLSGGEGGPLILTPKGSQGTDELVWIVPGQLEHDYDGDDTLDAPSALATFGVYRGNDRVIYWEER